jgi:hypothetical protein
MGGTSSQQQSQSSTTAPWAAAQPAITGILGQLQGLEGSSGLSSTDQSAISSLLSNAGSASQFAPAISNLAGTMLAGGGATSQNPALSANLAQYTADESPLANNTNYNPMSTPGLGTQLSTIDSDVTQQVNGAAAAAGRSGSPDAAMALGRGIAAGEAPVITNQYNQNVQNQQGAAAALYGAGNTTSGLLTGNNQTALNNSVAGIPVASAANDATNATANAQLAAAAQQFGIPASQLGLLAQIGIPIAGLGSQSTGQSSGTATESGAQQFGQIAGGIGALSSGLFGKAGVGGALTSLSGSLSSLFS